MYKKEKNDKMQELIPTEKIINDTDFFTKKDIAADYFENQKHNTKQKRKAKNKRVDNESRYKKRYNLVFKILAFFVCIISAVILVASSVGVIYFYYSDFYTQDKSVSLENEFDNLVYSNFYYDFGEVILNYDGQTDYLMAKALDYGVGITLKYENGQLDINEQSGSVFWSQTYSLDDLFYYSYGYNIQQDKEEVTVVTPYEEQNTTTSESENTMSVEENLEQSSIIEPTTLSTYNSFYSVTFTLFEEETTGEFPFRKNLIDLAYVWRYGIIFIGVFSLISTFASFIYLVCAVGHSPKSEKTVSNSWTKMPLEFSAIIFIAPLIFIFNISTTIYLQDFLEFAGLLVFGLIALGIALLFFLDLTVRFKTVGLWRSTLIYRILRAMFKFCIWLVRVFAHIFKTLPVLWQGLTIFIGLSIVLYFVALFEIASGARPIFMMYVIIVERTVLLALLLYAQFAFARLIKAGKELASGNVDFKVKTDYMLGAFKTHAEDLNSIGEGMVHAVDEKMKSERMKTELITNVSHDIKTPLTSIINYSDLISKEKTDNENIVEYTGIISKQSDRLKRLIEDLVEASKASTGNLEVNLQPCEVGVLLSQSVGEYSLRLHTQQLELIVKQPEEAVHIYADGRRLWRVFDNLLGNICKYAQKGTRVYLTLEQKGERAIISFKNISSTSLDISAEELLERFVRGDSSRNTEGNGLGLSIAQSLVELQGGKMKLFVDGDLFKVELSFDLIKE